MMASMIEIIESLYRFLEQLHLSVTGLVVAAAIFVLAFLFAVREAASWFFKIDDLKRDIGRLHEISLQLESELKLVQGLVIRMKETTASSPPTSTAFASTTTGASPMPTATAAATEPTPLTGKTGTAGFPITH